jgi:hypothetical protein
VNPSPSSATIASAYYVLQAHLEPVSIIASLLGSAGISERLDAGYEEATENRGET